MRNQLKAFLTALRFLTRLELGEGGRTPEDFHRSLAYFPLIGLLLGLILAACRQILAFHMPPAVQAGLLLALEVYLTGGLHLDGFMDSIDGLFSGRERERILAIMKDSHVGAHGVTAVIILLLLKFSLFFSLPPQPGWNLSPLLLIMPVLSRWSVVLALILFPYARSDGMGSLFGAGSRGGRSFLVGATVIALTIVYLVMGLMGLVLAFLVGLLAWYWGTWVCHRIGGLTGDTYGALAEIAEVYVLVLGLFLL
ncbi:MAG: adenosylcobinamide-GDP ribazoletransferase [Clostridia bacterium]|nr:adenosylcobinamide-GDP ribazoletransferase [Clostridia bacterium]